MANLFWKTKSSTKGILATPFKYEEEFEKFVVETKEILEDIFLIKEQVRGGNKDGIPDIIGVDNDGNICIVELKNVPVSADIIPQVLQYAIWAETNPDSTKALWLERPNKPDINIDWSNNEVRIIIIAPDIDKSTLDMADKINYEVDLIEVKRWVEKDNEFILVNKLEHEKKQRIKPVNGREIYDENFYMKNYNQNSVKYFYQFIKDIEAIISEKGWALETKYNKHYCGFKAGFFNAFGIEWVGSKTFAFFFKIDKESAEKVSIPMTKYEDGWKQAVYYVDPEKTKTRDFLPLLEAAYKKLAGK